jgi:predicted SAM-dependent methyltransferase
MYSLPFSQGDRVIELGGGDRPITRPNVDIRPGPHVDFTADFEAPLPIQSEEWNGVYCSYAIEHLSWRHVRGFVCEVHRILAPGGIAVIVTADAEAQFRWALSRLTWDEKISQCVGGDQDHPDNTHKVFFNPAWISRLFREVGFASTIVVPHGELGTDMILEARKARG